MSIHDLTVTNYRSIRSLSLPLQQINVLTGPNGCGKSNLYRSLYLLTMAAQGEFARTIADEGGMPSVLWAGPRKKGPFRMTIAVSLDMLAYELSCGLVPQASTAINLPEFVPLYTDLTIFDPKDRSKDPFVLDPSIKEENAWFIDRKTRLNLLERSAASATLRDSEGSRSRFDLTFSEKESILSQLQEPYKYPQLLTLQQVMKQWRFYHHFRTDPDAPLRHPQVGVFTPVLSHDGSDLAAALTSIVRVEYRDLYKAIDNAFPGAELIMRADNGRFSYRLKMPGINRELDARELSDGTIRYLCLLAALLSPHPAPLLALNEPESSLHPELLEPLARLIVQASKKSQIWITTHSEALANYIESYSGVEPVRLAKVNGETILA